MTATLMLPAPASAPALAPATEARPKAVGRYELKDGSTRWEARWRDDTGRQRSKKGFRNKAARDRFLRGLRTDLDRGEYRDPRAGRIALDAWCRDTWLAGATNLAPKTLELYREAVDRFAPVLGHRNLDRVGPEHVERYLAGRLASGAAPSSVHREYRALRRAFRLAVRRGKLTKSPMGEVAPPRVPGEEMLFLTADELMRLAAAIDGDLRTTLALADKHSSWRPSAQRYRTLILVAGWGGLRWGELAGLRASDVDVEHNRVRVAQQRRAGGSAASEPKSLAGLRWVTLPAMVMAEVAEHVEGMAPDELVWKAPQGTPLNHSNFLGWLEERDEAGRVTRAGRGRFRRALVAAGIDPATRPHDLRHTAAALAVKAGCHPKALQARLGHASIQTTLDRYGHLYPEMEIVLASALNGMLLGTVSA